MLQNYTFDFHINKNVGLFTILNYKLRVKLVTYSSVFSPLSLFLFLTNVGSSTNLGFIFQAQL